MANITINSIIMEGTTGRTKDEVDERNTAFIDHKLFPLLEDYAKNKCGCEDGTDHVDGYNYNVSMLASEDNEFSSAPLVVRTCNSCRRIELYGNGDMISAILTEHLANNILKAYLEAEKNEKEGVEE